MKPIISLNKNSTKKTDLKINNIIKLPHYMLKFSNQNLQIILIIQRINAEPEKVLNKTFIL